MTDVFVGYARTDRARVDVIVKHLRAEGWTVWYDDELEAGETYRTKIRQQIGAAKVAIVVWSKPSRESDWVVDEAALAKSLGKLVPVRIDNAAPPLGFGGVHTHSLADWDGTARAASFQTLIRVIRKRLDDIAEPVAEPLPAEPSKPKWRRFATPVLAVLAIIIAVAIIQPWQSPLSTPPDPKCAFADQFTGASLDPAWEVVRGTGDFVVAGGAVEITAQDGADIFRDQLQAPMLLRVPTGDFVLETEVAAEPRQWYQGAGLVLWNGSESYVRLERGFGDVGAVIFEYRNGGPHVKVHSPSRDDPQLIQTDADPVVLQLSKAADAVSARWRPAQDQQWQELGTIEMALPDTTKAGVAVLNRAQNGAAPAPFSARFDYVRSSCA